MLGRELPRLTKAQSRLFEFLRLLDGHPISNEEARQTLEITRSTLRIGLDRLNEAGLIRTERGRGRQRSRHLILVSVVRVVPRRVSR